MMSRNNRQGWFWALLLAVAVIWFGNLEYRKLVKPDEGRYAEISREMVTSGDWTTPRLNDLKYFEKPPLQYWTTAAAFEAFGLHNWTARLWTALTGLLGIALVYYTGRRVWGGEVGLYAAAVLGSSLLYVMIGHMNSLDMGLTFFMALGMCGFVLAQHDGATVRENRIWMHVAWAALALAVLSKGLIGIVLPGAVLVLYTLIQRDWALWKRLHLVTGTLLFFAISAPWFVAVSRANPEFAHFFFIHEHFERFLTTEHKRYEPWWWFLPVLAIGILPWLANLPQALWLGGRSSAAVQFQPQRFLLVWAVFIFVFFSMSGSKLASYILPIFPALALLMALQIERMNPRRLFWTTLPMLLAALGLLVLSQFADRFGDADEAMYYHDYARWLALAAVVWLGGLSLGLYWLYRQRVRAGVLAIAVASLLFSQLAITGHNSLAPLSSASRVAQQVQPYLKPDTPFYSLYMYDNTLSFYLQRPLTLVAFDDEMAFGLEQEPAKGLSFDAFLTTWRNAPQALAITETKYWKDMQKQIAPTEVIYQDIQYVVI
ncbi:MAG TPA: glycosyltransferase family 39 protein, partial [Gallionellaceae bacterium]|nr:glycosyltransferase family 39 protein [Gallionellaceae bacterium]